jgi:methylmalonyl-CoA mutase
MYLETLPTNGKPAGEKTEEPTRLFAGLGIPQDTNARFHYLTKHQRSARLSTAFDGPTLYGIDSDSDGVFGKIGEGGVAVDTVDDMVRLYDGFDLTNDQTSVSMTINGPAPTILAMFIAGAKRRFGDDVVAKLRGTIQADILKEVQAQNEMLFPIEASLRFLTDMVEWTTGNMPRWYPISISGYHIAEAGATPVQQAAYTLSNGFAYAELFEARGMDVNRFGPRLSFFLDCGLDVEYLALARVCRKIWAIGMRDIFGAEPRAQILKLHTQTSGRSLVAHTFKNNLTRTAIELMLSYINATNSCHSNSADEPFTTPGEEYVKLAANAQAIVLEESGVFKHMMNSLGSSPGIKAAERAVEAAILEEFRQIDQLGGVLAAIEHRYQRSQIQSAAHRYEQQIYDNTRPVVGLNRYRDEASAPEVKLVRTPVKHRKLQIERLAKFKHKHRKDSPAALDRLSNVVESGGNVFGELIETVEHCSLGQITERLQEVVGKYRPTI